VDTNNRVRRRFNFTISELGILLGKRPVTLRAWERSGMATFPRDQRGNRSFNTEAITEAASNAYARGRITKKRYDLIHAAMTLLELIENESS
jgi:hypothetical protein